MPEKLLLRPEEAAETLGISLSRVYALLAAGKLPYVRIGKTMRIPVQQLQEWIQQQVDGKGA